MGGNAARDTIQQGVESYASLLSAGHMLSRAVLALQFANADPSGEYREQALEELYRANDAYVDAYAKVNPKGGLT